MFLLTTSLVTIILTVHNCYPLLKTHKQFSETVLFSKKSQTNIVENLTIMKRQVAPVDDTYTEEFLKQRYNTYKTSYHLESELINKGIPIRHQNPPEDMTENMVKFIIELFRKLKF